ncbi:hypothetical protein TNCV_209961 [Trichonephila clavipes]|uniref:Uncharacterized protein n=1 Tax=Trichonephila clavipes TaxID=2585209 RepID=A0A8X6VS77_TRICX|nr:hypothetical protein TNCV_209961 [Trichonephila clavipes]
MIQLVHPWYQRKYPGGSLVRGNSIRDQTGLIRFISGHLMSLTFVDGIKDFKICTKCSSAQASPLATFYLVWGLPGRTWFKFPYWFSTSSG